MKIKTNLALHHYRTGIPLWEDKVAGKPLTLRTICCNSLRGAYPGDPALAGYDNCLRRTYIADRMEDNDEVLLEPAEIALVKKVVGLNFPDPALLRSIDDGLAGKIKTSPEAPEAKPAPATTPKSKPAKRKTTKKKKAKSA